MRASLAIAVAVLLRGPARAQDANAVLGEGLEQLRQARFEAAAESFRRAVNLDPSLKVAQYDLGICYFAEGQFEKADKAFEQTLLLSPDNRFAQYYLARIRLIQNRLTEAISSFEALARQGPVADEYYYLGSAYWQKGDLIAAVQALKRTAELKPADSRVHYLLARVYRREGKTAEAEEELQRSSDLREISQNEKQQLKSCDSAVRSLPRNVAMEECRRMLDGDNPAELVSLGTVFAQIGELQAALDPLMRAAHLDNEDYESRFNLGLVYLHLKQYSEAKPWLSAAVSLQPESFEAIALLGSALFSLGEDLAAFEQLNHAHRLQPNNDKVVRLLLSECQMISRHALAEGNYAQAVTYLENAFEVQPSASDIHELAFQVAKESFVHSNYESAIRALKVSSQSMQRNADFHAMLGFANYKQGNAGTAVRELQRAMDLDHGNLNYVLQLSEVFVANNNAEASITLLEAATHVFPESAKVWFALGTSEIAAEHLEGGEEALKRAKTLDPNLDEIYVVLGQAYRNASRWNDLLVVSEKLMQENKSNYIGYFYKAFALAREPDGDSKEIEKLLERACSLDTDDPEPHYELAKLDAHRGDKDGAILELEKATRANPHFAQAYYQLHRLYAERGDAVRSAEAERTYEGLRKEREQPVRKLLVRVRER